MISLSGKSANELWIKAKCGLINEGPSIQQESRAGDVKYEQLAVTLCLTDPRNRWICSRQPALNLPFALAEFIWIVNAENEAAFLNFFNSKLPHFSGQEKEYYGAYGYRLRKHFEVDQLDLAYETLKHNPRSRQVVLQLWDSRSDLPSVAGNPRSADIPCNIMSMLKVRDNRLHWTQIMRSNDIYRGLPYNFVQFTFLHELLSAWLDLELGPYIHFSDSLHCYKTDFENIKKAQSINCPPNLDRIVGTKDNLDGIFKDLYEIIKGAIEEPWMGDLRYNDLMNDLKVKLPQFLLNIASVLMGEIRRRRTPKELRDGRLVYQTNPVYDFMWKRWTASLE